ncbi:hypothetical protein [Cryptosporangium sp. NPDC048952]|uniref:hypothetical protein n=1 Tax=Cryptosporangium sp. NPDC048952 TaxID=3363961 RepID=UPI003715F3D4
MSRILPDFNVGVATPEQLWDRLGESVKARINVRAGTILEWWAAPGADQRPAVTVLGTNALIVAEPILGSDGRLANRLTSVPLDPASLRRARILEKSEAKVPENRRRSEIVDLRDHLPPQVRELMDEPFAARPPETLQHVQYYVPVLERAILRIWYYITDQRSLTFATGLGHGFRDGVGADSWDVTCWRATVRQPER